MRSFFVFAQFLFLSVSIFSQKLSQIQFSGGANLISFAFKTDQQIIIKISVDGKVLDWGSEVELRRSNYQPGDIQPYMGRVDYYGETSDSAYRGKVKSIGTCVLTYYGYNEIEAKVGKIKTIGRVAFDYFSDAVDKSLKGKIKTMGYDALNFYSDFENESYKGKIKAIGAVPITYYSSFDDKLISGKIKSVGIFNYTWYTAFDRREYQGSLRSGLRTQLINGVLYIIM